MEAGKSQDLWGESANWRLRRANGLILVWVQMPENQESWWYSYSLNVGRLKTQEKLMFSFELEDKKRKEKKKANVLVWRALK